MCTFCASHKQITKRHEVENTYIYAKASFKLNPKSNVTAFIHNFYAAGDINNTVSNQLGTEVDFIYNYKFIKEIGIKEGCSHLFPSEGMEVLKNNIDNNTNNWSWIMVTVKPTLFQKKKINNIILPNEKTVADCSSLYSFFIRQKNISLSTSSIPTFNYIS